VTDQEPRDLPAAPARDAAGDVVRDAARDDPREASRDGQWLSYAELGEIRGIGRESAKKLALKQGWRRVPGNDGANRVFVPGSWLRPAREPSREPARDPVREPPRDSSRGLSALQASFDAALKAIEASHAGEVAALTARAEASERRAEATDAKLTAAETARVATVVLAADLQARVERAQAEAAAAAQRAEAMERAEAERQARGLLARLRAAVRGG
jgi:hypothetical protein